MILKNKKLLMLTSLLILLPIPVGLLLKGQFPGEFMADFGFTLYMPPLSLLAGHWLCILMTNLDPGHRDRNRKPLTMVLWILPLMSNLVSGILYALMLGVDFSPYSWMTGAMGLMFAAIGNYMPKTKMNSTLGIKVSWTYSSEANWNATHRYAGKVWVIGGVLLMLGIFLPENAAVVLMLVVMGILCVLPVWYSRRFYLRERAEGKAEKAGYPPVSRRLGKWAMVFLTVLLVFTAAVLFTGDLNYHFREDSLLIEADHYSDNILYYGVVESVEYREGNVEGIRIGGFGSLRLLMGWFKNEEFGTYIRYTYYKPEACVIVTTQGNTLVLSGENEEQTQQLYQRLLEKTNN